MLKPKVEAVQPEPHIPWEVDGSVLTVGSGDETVVIDLEERRTDSETVIDIYKGPKGLGERNKCGSYVLSVEIPPRRYREETAEQGDGEGASVTLAPEPLDMASVVLRLWTAEIETEEI